MTLIPKAVVAVPLPDEAAATALRLSIQPPLTVSVPTTFPGMGEVRGPRAALEILLGPRRGDGWHLAVEWVPLSLE